MFHKKDRLDPNADDGYKWEEQSEEDLDDSEEEYQEEEEDEEQLADVAADAGENMTPVLDGIYLVDSKRWLKGAEMELMCTPLTVKSSEQDIEHAAELFAKHVKSVDQLSVAHLKKKDSIKKGKPNDGWYYGLLVVAKDTNKHFLLHSASRERILHREARNPTGDKKGSKNANLVALFHHQFLDDKGIAKCSSSIYKEPRVAKGDAKHKKTESDTPVAKKRPIEEDSATKEAPPVKKVKTSVEETLPAVVTMALPVAADHKNKDLLGILVELAKTFIKLAE